MISLRKRFLKHTAIVVFSTMLLSVVIIERHYVAKITEQSQMSLRIHLYALLSVAYLENNQLTLPAILSNPDFNSSNSGLWAAVFTENNETHWQSLSSPDDVSEIELPVGTGDWHFSQQQVADQDYLLATYSIVWDQNNQQAFHVVVAENSETISSDVTDFRVTLAIGVGSITLLLLIFHYLVLRSAFKPIARLEQEIGRMERGELEHLSEQYPKELIGVSHNLNALIDKEHSQRERYRSAMADLAHSLKTPVTIINGELAQYPDNTALQNALVRLNTSIEYQLQRAVISGHKFLSQGTPLIQILDMVLEAMNKIYSDNPSKVVVSMSKDTLFYGDENDMLEILGNLLDNAFKYGDGEIHITAKQTDQELTIDIEDNGRGFSRYDQNRIFNRGERLDQQGLGQGIGLAVVYDILHGYKGNISASSSQLGGAMFRLTFPKLRATKK